MANDPRKQINFRIDDDLRPMIEDLRRWRSPIPTIAELFRELVEKAHERERREGKRK